MKIFLVKLLNQFIQRVGGACYSAMGCSRSDLFAQGGFDGIAVKQSQGNDLIRRVLEEGGAKMISRLGFFEANAILNHIEIQQSDHVDPLVRIDSKFRGLRACWDENLLSMLHNNAGVFPNNHDTASRFSDLYIDCFSEMDILGVFRKVPGEFFLWRKYCPNAMVVELKSLEPFRHQSPWSAGLKGKKVLVIHPFAKTIQEQYRKREAIFQDLRVLPQFELKTLKAVQSIAENSCGFASWFDALEWMKGEMEKTDFDVCLVGAGAYGLPLAAHAKSLRKVAIHMGGALQILFGIKGARWEKFIPEVAALYNDAWVRPANDETPLGNQKIEEGCYW